MAHFENKAVTYSIYLIQFEMTLFIHDNYHF